MLVEKFTNLCGIGLFCLTLATKLLISVRFTCVTLLDTPIRGALEVGSFLVFSNEFSLKLLETLAVGSIIHIRLIDFASKFFSF